MARQYEIALSEIMYELAEKKKRGLPGWVVPTAATTGAIGGGLLAHKYLTPQVGKALEDASEKAYRVGRAATAGAGFMDRRAEIMAKFGKEQGRRVDIGKVTPYASPAVGALAGGTLVGGGTSLIGGRKKKER
jgi:hypothetical protein